jgi:hypothetical protein
VWAAWPRLLLARPPDRRAGAIDAKSAMIPGDPDRLIHSSSGRERSPWTRRVEHSGAAVCGPGGGTPTSPARFVSVVPIKARGPPRTRRIWLENPGQCPYYKICGPGRPGGRPAAAPPPAQFPFLSFLDSGDAASLPDAGETPTSCTDTARPTPSRSAGPGHRCRLAQETDFPPDPLRYEYGAGWPLGCARLATEIKGLRHRERFHGSIQRTP